MPDESALYEQVWWTKKETAQRFPGGKALEPFWGNLTLNYVSGKGGKLRSLCFRIHQLERLVCFRLLVSVKELWTCKPHDAYEPRCRDRLGGQISWVLVCRHIVPLLRRSCPAYTMNTIMHIYKESLVVIVYISKDHFTVAVKLHGIGIVVELIKDHFRHFNCQDSTA